jgi:hypothetical protein
MSIIVNGRTIYGPDCENSLPDGNTCWSPILLNDLNLWIDASNTASFTLDGDDRVAQWDDLSGNERHVTQIDSSSRPYYNTESLNGLDVVDFPDGESNYLDIPSIGITENDPRTIFTVFKIDTTDGPAAPWNSTIWSFNEVYDSDRLIFYVTANTGHIWIGWDGGTTGTPSAVGNLNVWRIHSFRIDRMGDWEHTIRGHRGLKTGNTTLETKDKNNVIGRRNGGTYLNGHLAEMLVFSRNLSASDYDKVAFYLSKKWGFSDLWTNNEYYSFI